MPMTTVTALQHDRRLPLNPAESVDTDSDGTGNNADTDDDGDGTPDTSDAFPSTRQSRLTPIATAQAIMLTTMMMRMA